MTSTHRTWALPFLAALLWGCSAAALAAFGLPASSVPQKDLQNISRVGVISALGDTFHGIHLGLTVFGNRSYSASVPIWNMDAFALRETERLFRERSTIHVEPLTLTNEQRESVYGPGDPESVSFDYALEMSRAFGAEYLLFVYRVHGGMPPLQFHRGGYGYFDREALGVRQQCAYVALAVLVFDVASGRKIAFQSPDPCFYGLKTVPEPRASFDDYSDEDKAALQTAIKLEMTKVLDKAFTKLKLIQKLK